MANFKTNAMRILDKAGVSYNIYTYDNSDGLIDGISVASKINRPIEQVYKTLVAQGASKSYYVFIIPVASELDLKSAARAVGEKSVSMIKAADINTVTGYVRGGCSPFGMKKQYQTVLDHSSSHIDSIIVSAGKIGYQIEVSSDALVKLTDCRVADIVVI